MTATLSRISMPTPVGVLTIIASDAAIVAIRWDTERDDRQPDPHHSAKLDEELTDVSSGEHTVLDRAVAQLGEELTDVSSGEHTVLDRAVAQLGEYFAGTRTEFDLPLAPEGTAFQHEAWDALTTIPFGETITYGEQARLLGDTNKSRAVGAANGRNPIPIVVPCHRVVGSKGQLTGFAGGLDIKAWLLDHEFRVRASA